MRIEKIIASGLGTGYVPIAPGTMGALLGTIVTFAFNYGLLQLEMNKIVVLGANVVSTIIITFIGVWAIKYVHTIWDHDDGRIVIDEIVGVAITLLALPLDWKYYVIGFVVFRFFDILKPLGIKKIDLMDGNWSVMLDDVLAGMYAFIVVQFIVAFV